MEDGKREESEERTTRDGAPGADADGDELPGLAGLVGTFFAEPSLWPVLVVVLASGGVFGAALIALSVVDRNPFAALALLLVAGMSLDGGLRSLRRPGPRPLARLIALLWVAALGFTALAVWSGLAGS